MEASDSNIRELIREFIEEEIKNEMSGVGAIAGFTLPLGMSSPNVKEPKVKKRKKKMRLKESLSGKEVGYADFTFHNHIRYPNNEDTYGEEEHSSFYDAIQAVSDAFARAENPFGKNRDAGLKKATEYLQGYLEYPHKT